MKATKQSIENFLSQKTFAIAGVSRNKDKFGNSIFKELKSKGYKVYPVNPKLNEFENEKCYGDLNNFPEKPGALIICVKPKETFNIVQQAFKQGITNIWMQKGSESDEALSFCKEKNINVVYRECILMFIQPVSGAHKFHRTIRKIFGGLPK